MEKGKGESLQKKLSWWNHQTWSHVLNVNFKPLLVSEQCLRRVLSKAELTRGQPLRHVCTHTRLLHTYTPAARLVQSGDRTASGSASLMKSLNSFNLRIFFLWLLWYICAMFNQQWRALCITTVLIDGETIFFCQSRYVLIRKTESNTLHCLQEQWFVGWHAKLNSDLVRL